MPHRPGIYLILNVLDGKSYVGSSRDVVRRLYVHRRMLRRGEHHSPQFQRAFDRDGEAAFSFAVIERCDLSALLVREQVWINERRSADSAFGYNVCAVSGTRAGVPQPESQKAALRNVHLGKPKSAETRAKMSAAAKGRVKTEAHKQKLREAATLQLADPERRAKAAEYGRMAKPHWTGKTMPRDVVERQRTSRLAFYADKPKAVRKKAVYKRKEGPHLKSGPKPGVRRTDLRAFTDDQIRTIRALRPLSYAKIAARFDSDPATIHAIVARKTYADVL